MQAAAALLEEQIWEYGSEVLLEWMDRSTFVSRINRGRSLGAVFMAELRQTLDFEDLLGPVVQSLRENGSYRLLRLVERDGQTRARFRLVGSDFNLNYHDVLFVREPGGGTRIGDLYVFAGGEDLSDLLGRIYEDMLREEASGEPGRMTSFYQSFNGRRFREAWDTFPADLLTDANRKALLLIRLRIAMQVGEEELAEAVADYAAAFPEDPSLPLNEVDHLFLAGHYEEALSAIDRLDTSIGGDLYLDAVRAGVYLEQDQIALARSFARRATEADPSNESAVLMELGVSQITGEYARTIDLIDHLEAHLGYTFNPLEIEANPDNAGLILSEPYRLWRAER